MTIFEYGEKEIAYLCKRDKKLSSAIEKIGFLERKMMPDVFEAIVNCIVAQQISGKVAEKIYDRLENFCGKITWDIILTKSEEDLQKCGLSNRKAVYIKTAAKAFAEGVIIPEKLKNMSDKEVIEALSSLYGLGKWSAEMIMIFSLGRKDILSYGDFGIKQGLKNLYGHKEITKELFEKYRKRYSPYGSVASLYLWELASSRQS